MCLGATLVLPNVPFVFRFGFILLPAPRKLMVLGKTTLDILVTEISKKYFYSRMKYAIA